jgi:uncharacterized protein
MTHLLMPKATAVWLIDNTSLTFDQVAAFCTLHPLEVKAIADGEAAAGIMGVDPIQNGQLTRDEITKAENNPAHKVMISPPKVKLPPMKARRGPRYTPLSRRQDRPNAILWLVRNHPELPDAAISRLAGTTKNTIDAIRDRTHWNSATLQAIDPVALGLCSQIDLDFEVGRANKNKPKQVEAVATIVSVQETILNPVSFETFEKPAKKEEEHDVESVFGKLKNI